MAPSISCIMLTYNRFPMRRWLIEEAVECFLRQDCDVPLTRELIIVNDTPGQTLTFDHRATRGSGLVKILNLDYRCPRLTDKIHLGIQAAQGQYLCRWDDDDIHLPHRLSFSYRKLERTGQLEWRAANYFYSPQGQMYHTQNPGNTHIMALWDRKVLDLIGGYPTDLSSFEDQIFNQRLADAGISQSGETIERHRIYYIYRWGTSPYHLSGQIGGPPDNPHQAHYDDIGKLPIVKGTFAINPHWRRNYVADVIKAAAQK